MCFLFFIYGIVGSYCFSANKEAVACLNRIIPTEGAIYVITVTRELGQYCSGEYAGHLTLTKQRFDFLKETIERYCSDSVKLFPRNALKIFVFNECFFQKYEPIDKGDSQTYGTRDYYINEFKQISRSCPNTVFYVNLLYRKQINVLKEADDVVQRNTINYEINCKHAAFKCSDFNNKFLLPKEPPFYIVRNVTYGFCCGEKITKYKKRTYCREWDEGLPFCYDFGDGVDKKAKSISNEACNAIAEKLINSVSTEICFDLFKGVRRNNHWENHPFFSQRCSNDRYPALHIIQSNWINPFDKNNIINLPTETLIVHADPKDPPPAGVNLFIVGNSRRGIYPENQRWILSQMGDNISLRVWKIG